MPFKAYTKKYDKIIDAPITKCYVGEPTQDLHRDEIRGLWDTGATCSLVSGRVASLLGIMPVSKTTIGHANGQSVVNLYNISVVLPNDVLLPFIEVAEGAFSNFDLLIGMDIISKGDLSISNKDGKTTFSFRIPSYKEIDFMAEFDEISNNNQI